jgi:hypothetical protein
MMRHKVLAHEFVEFIPDELKEGTIYVCVGLATVVHKCCCGCGNEVVTPLSPTDWKLTFDGETITLHPSIGNWSFKCQSHYWIRNNRVWWAPRWSQEEMDAGRIRDRFAKERYFGTVATSTDGTQRRAAGEFQLGTVETSLWRKLKAWWQTLR